MFKYESKYTDYDGKEQTEICYFNLNQAELIELQARYPGGLKSVMERILEAKDQLQLVPIVKDILLSSYGIRVADSKYFMKSEEEKKKFECSPAYSDIFMKICRDEEFAVNFINAVAPPTESMT